MGILMILLSAISVFAGNESGTIQIKFAEWSKKDVTSFVQSWCDGKTSCDYKISSKFIGDPQDSNDQSFRLIWTCVGPEYDNKVESETKADGKVLSLNCENAKKILKKTAVAPTRQQSTMQLEGMGAWTTEKVLSYPSSFHASLMSNERAAWKDSISSACIEAVRKHLNSGRTFRSKVMEEKYTQLVQYSTQREVRDGEFFHYTKASNIIDIARRGAYDEIFTYLRSSSFYANWFFYVAADSSSSKQFGPIKATIQLRRDARIYSSNHALNERFAMNGHAGDIEVENELVASDPSLYACRDPGIATAQTGHRHSVLALLAAEANHIDLIAYFGLDSDWYQMLGPWAIQSMTAQ